MTELEVGSQDCPLCGDSGWKQTADASGVVRCDCHRRASSRRLIQSAAIPSRYQHNTFDNFDTGEVFDASLGAAKLLCSRYVERYEALDYGLLFMGPPGIGKTHLGVAVLRALIERYGIAGVFVDYRDLLRSIQDSYNPISQTSEMEILKPVLKADVVVLDELGARRPTNWVSDTVNHIINERYNDDRITLITTNYQDEPGAEVPSLEERVGIRLRSRLYEMCRPVRMRGGDYRHDVKQAAYR